MLRESPFLELVSAWSSISPEEKREALLQHRGLVNAFSPGLWEQLNQQKKHQEKEAKEQRKADLEAARAEAAEAKETERQARKTAAEIARRQKSIPIRIGQIQRSLQSHSYRDERQQRKLEKTREKLMDQIIKQIRT